jgi:hypothetical protein
VVKVISVAKKKQRVNDAYANQMVDGEDEDEYDEEYDEEYYDEEDDDDDEGLMESGIDPDMIVRLHNVTVENGVDDDRFPCPRAMALLR